MNRQTHNKKNMKMLFLDLICLLDISHKIINDCDLFLESFQSVALTLILRVVDIQYYDGK